MDVLLRYEPRVTLLRAGFLAQAGELASNPLREGGAAGRAGKVEEKAAGEKGEEIGAGAEW